MQVAEMQDDAFDRYVANAAARQIEKRNAEEATCASRPPIVKVRFSGCPDLPTAENVTRNLYL
jgi:hypothetical protein